MPDEENENGLIDEEDEENPENSEEDFDYPETPATAPTHDYHVANKKYCDDNVPTVPVKATGAEVNTGTNDAKFATPKAIADSNVSFELSYPSATLQLSEDAEVDSGAGGGAYIKVKELTSTVSGAIKTMFEIKKNGDNGPTTTIAGKIYVNGVAVGAEHITNNTHTDGYEVFTDASISVEVGDLVQVYMKSIDSAYDGQCQNFRLYWDILTKEYIDNVVDIGDDAILALVPTVFKVVVATRDLTTASGVQNIAHGLGVIPKYVRITAVSIGRNASRQIHSYGFYNGITNSCIFAGETGSSDTVSGSSATQAIYLQPNTGGVGDKQTGIVTFDATNVIITWTKTDSPVGTAYILVEAFG